MRHAFAVVDLGFGDAGKGLVTDALVRRTGATAVVRFNGGAQAAHNVATADGRHHTFAQFGSGTLVAGVETFLSRHVVMDPLALAVEEHALRAIGVTDGFERLRIHEAALVATPYHRALNQAREAQRGIERHGSCGVGFGETVSDALAHPSEALRAGDLREPGTMKAKLAHLAARALPELRALGAVQEAEALAAPEVTARLSDAFATVGQLGVIADAARWADELTSSETVVFEGAQGLLLCEVHGFPPHTTWSRCDLHNLREILAEAGEDVPLTRLGVLRAVAVRHGAGPFPTEVPALRGNVHEHNQANPWQGPVRYGWFDAVLARYAIAAVGGIEGLALTHLDTLAKLSSPQVCTGYRVGDRSIRDLALAATPEEIAERLRQAVPVLEPFDRQALPALLGCTLAGEARGPTAADVSFLAGF